MMIRSAYKGFLFLMTTLLTSHAIAQEAGHFNLGGKQVDTGSFNQQIRTLMAECNIPATSVALIDNGAVVFFNAYGVKKDTDLVTKETVFEACSLSKTFLLYAVYKLADEGRLDLDKPLYEYLENERLKHDPRYKKITARMVMSHSSGIENWSGFNNGDTLEIVSEPGTKYVYSGEGYVYLSEVVATILQKKYVDYMKERVLEPLQLNHTYTHFTEDEKHPDNYAIGHDPFGRSYEKWINTEPEPASGINTVANDYAKLILAIFGGKNLSATRIHDIMQPVVKLNEKDSTAFFGPGFVVLRNATDTLIYQGGDNEGWKACVLYSVVQKKGLVLMTNSDRGLVMLDRLNQSSVNLDIRPILSKLEFTRQYPNDVTTLLATYKKKGFSQMIKTLDELIDSRKIQPHTLNELSFLIYQYDWRLAQKLLHKNLAMTPSDSLSYYMLGAIAFRLKDYNEARDCFRQARQMKFADFDNNYALDLWLSNCQRNINDLQTRSANKTTIQPGQKARVESEYYNRMYAMENGNSEDTDNTNAVMSIDKDGWLEYKVYVGKPGKYNVSFRVNGTLNKETVTLKSGTKVVARIDKSSLKEVEGWNTITTTAQLPAGWQTMKLNMPATTMSINWFEFTPVR
ncbi:serine hydrolase [Chitinophaga pendula]|uniref:serine hydrolase n=1 Tax=Chitinophaga TaxID=79328 RepID=UPI000BB07BCC|nr:MULTISPECIES: serine hydrolase [Chitinophaga]ASZ13659.1 hypothetical protein CK934_23245 [Chitinophaga sp. MD30]UCJ08716.1 serine hydrolase [Chitinophaga pendula]